MSALLQQRSLELSQLYGRLPSYVPPTVKRYIIHQYAAITHQKRHPVSPGLELKCPIALPLPTSEAPKQLPSHRASVLRPGVTKFWGPPKFRDPHPQNFNILGTPSLKS